MAAGSALWYQFTVPHSALWYQFTVPHSAVWYQFTVPRSAVWYPCTVPRSALWYQFTVPLDKQDGHPYQMLQAETVCKGHCFAVLILKYVCTFISIIPAVGQCV